MGWGVEDDETFEALVEKRLNEELAGQGYERYEILNLGVAGYYPLQQARGRRKGSRLSAASGPVHRDRSRALAKRRLPGGGDEEGHRSALPRAPRDRRESGSRAGMNEDEAVKRLAPFREEIAAAGSIGHIAERCRAQGALPVWVFLPSVEPGPWMEETAPATEHRPESRIRGHGSGRRVRERAAGELCGSRPGTSIPTRAGTSSSPTGSTTRIRKRDELPPACERPIRATNPDESEEESFHGSRYDRENSQRVYSSGVSSGRERGGAHANRRLWSPGESSIPSPPSSSWTFSKSSSGSPSKRTRWMRSISIL